MLKILFIDRITFFSLLRVLVHGRTIQAIWHFENISPVSRKILAFLQSLGLVKAKVRQINNHVGQMTDDKGRFVYLNYLAEARALTSRIKNEHLRGTPLLNNLKSIWAPQTVAWYFEMAVEEEIRFGRLRIGMVEWLIRTQLGALPEECALIMARTKWGVHLDTLATAQGIRVIRYGSIYLGALAGKIYSVAGHLSTKGPALINRLLSSLRRKKRKNASSASQSLSGTDTRIPGTVAIRYGFRKLSFNPAERSEFFWLNKSGIPWPQVLLYGFQTAKPLEKEIAGQLEGHGVRLIGHGPGIPAWKLSWRILPILIRTLTRIAAGAFDCLRQGQRVSPYYLGALITLALRYSYWYDFFSINRVIISVAQTFTASVAQNLALSSLGGISIAYQYSVIHSPMRVVSYGEDVQLVFSKFQENRLWREVDAPVAKYVPVGCIYDFAAKHVEESEKITEVRNRLHEAGADFIMCYFDENTSNRWQVYAWDEDAVKDYEFILKWLLDDVTLGVIFKPKNSKTLLKRLSRISNLIAEAEASGRCVFLMSENTVGDVYPAEAAMMADLCIGHLDGISAALEGRLAGVPALLVDFLGFYNHPFYSWDSGNVVFGDWMDVRKAVEAYRKAPGANPGFGDWSPAMAEFDPYGDGRSNLRMGSYIQYLHEALTDGASKQEAIAIAGRKFEMEWGIGATDDWRDIARMPKKASSLADETGISI